MTSTTRLRTPWLNKRRSARSTGARPVARGPRRARLTLTRIDPFTTLRFSMILSIAHYVVWLIIIGVLYLVLQATGIIETINHAVTTINGAGSSPPVTPSVVFEVAAVVGVVNGILFVALSTIGAMVYTLCADLIGGIEVTLTKSSSEPTHAI